MNDNLLKQPSAGTDPDPNAVSRPSEVVLEILPETHKGPFTKEDGEHPLDAEGKRIG